jgi:hypothetical protein
MTVLNVMDLVPIAPSDQLTVTVRVLMFETVASTERSRVKETPPNVTVELPVQLFVPPGGTVPAFAYPTRRFSSKHVCAIAVAVVKFRLWTFPRTTPVVSAAVPNNPIVSKRIAIKISISVNPACLPIAKAAGETVRINVN